MNPTYTHRGGLFVAVVLASSCSNPIGPGRTGSTPPPIDCSAFASGRTSPYALPWAVGRRFKVDRTFDHYTTLNGGVGLYAIDFDLPMRTPVHAARAGEVVAVEARFSDSDHADFHENWVMVRHTDGTVGRYIHLSAGGAHVSVGDIVAQGDQIGLSGNSGASNGPHLHFDVQSCGPNLPPGYNRLPCGMTVPVSFANTETHSCGLDPGKTYGAEPLSPAVR